MPSWYTRCAGYAVYANRMRGPVHGAEYKWQPLPPSLRRSTLFFFYIVPSFLLLCCLTGFNEGLLIKLSTIDFIQMSRICYFHIFPSYSWSWNFSIPILLFFHLTKSYNARLMSNWYEINMTLHFVKRAQYCSIIIQYYIMLYNNFPMYL